jgi:uncharacterized DUF497 family protein
MQILWDEPKRRANLDKHGFDFAALGVEFFQSAVIKTVRLSRMQAIGEHGNKLVVVIFMAYGSEAISVISMRKANHLERKLVRWQKTRDV